MKFRKPIVSAGVYRVADATGNRRWDVITADRLKRWAANHAMMKEAGFLLPGPWNHDLSAVPVKMDNQADLLARADNNAGYWDNLAVEQDENGVDTLYGDIDAPGDENDHNSPAGKIGKTVRETSIFAAPEYELGNGLKVKDALLHVALVTHPVEGGQKNFAKVDSKGGLSLAMSARGYSIMATFPDNDQTPPTPNDALSPPGELDGNTDLQEKVNTDFPTILKKLKEKGIILPDDTTPGTFQQRLLTAILQNSSGLNGLPLGQGPSVSTKKPPKGSQEQPPASVAMSAAPVTPVENPEVVKLQAALTLMGGHITSLEKQKRADRINALVATGRISADHAKSHLEPLLGSFQMSLDAGSPPQAIDSVLASLEAVLPTPAAQRQSIDPKDPVAIAMSVLGGVMVPPVGSQQASVPAGFFGQPAVTEEEGLATANLFLNNTGVGGKK